ncbi:MAG: hypothetical protein IJC67_02315 [Clostridia bacterium]|nr:hypothetical protein [Clostridia bacterium]
MRELFLLLAIAAIVVLLCCVCKPLRKWAAKHKIIFTIVVIVVFLAVSLHLPSTVSKGFDSPEKALRYMRGEDQLIEKITVYGTDSIFATGINQDGSNSFTYVLLNKNEKWYPYEWGFEDDVINFASYKHYFATYAMHPESADIYWSVIESDFWNADGEPSEQITINGEHPVKTYDNDFQGDHFSIFRLDSDSDEYEIMIGSQSIVFYRAPSGKLNTDFETVLSSYEIKFFEEQEKERQ